MKWLMVGKTVVPFDPDGKVSAQFLLMNEQSVQLCPTLGDLVRAIRDTKIARNDEETRCIKNDAPAAIWVPDGCKVTPDTVLECERLDKQTLRDLIGLLRR